VVARDGIGPPTGIDNAQVAVSSSCQIPPKRPNLQVLGTVLAHFPRRRISPHSLGNKTAPLAGGATRFGIDTTPPACPQKCVETGSGAAPLQIIDVVEKLDVGPERGQGSEQERPIALGSKRLPESTRFGGIHMPFAPVCWDRFDVVKLGKNRC